MTFRIRSTRAVLAMMLFLCGTGLRVSAWRITVPEGDQPTESVDRLGRVNVDRLNVRARPGTSYEVVAKVVRDQELTIFSQKGEWLEIAPPPGTVAWCSAQYVDQTGRITGDNVRIRAGPGVVFSVYATLDADSKVELIGDPTGEWQQIVAPGNARVWVHGQFVEPVVTAEVPADDGAKSVDAAVDVMDDNKDDEAGEPGDIPKLSVDDIARIDSGEVPVDQVLKPVPAGDHDESTDANTTAASADEALLKTGQLPSLADDVDIDSVSPDAVMIDDAFIDHGEGTGSSPVANSESREGTLVSLKTKANDFATHALVRREEDKAYLICYVVSKLLKLQEWENHRVRIYGKPVTYPGWRTDVLQATGIQLLNQ